MVLKLVAVFGYLLALLVIGAVAAKRVKDVGDYFAGGKSLGFWVVAFSSRATGESAWLLLGLTGMGAAIGAQAFWVVLGEVLGVGGAWLFMARRFKKLTDRYDSITIPDYLESRFRDDSQRLRKIAAITLVVFVTIYVSAQIDATGTAFETFLGWNYYVGAVVGFVVVLVYIVSGGFIAVAWSDAFQGTLMFLGLVTLPLVGTWVAGGVGEVTAGLAAQDPTLLEIGFGDGLLGFASVLSLTLIGLGFLGSPQVFVRFISIRSPNEVNRGAAVAISYTVIALSGAVLTGMVGRHLLVEASEDFTAVLGNGAQNVLPLMVEAYLPAVLAGVFIAIVLSAIMSTVDSLLIVAASALVRDWYQKVNHPDLPDDALIALSRKATVVLALVALAVALGVATLVPGRTVFWFVIFGWSGISATFCPTMILSVFWKGMTGRGAVVAMIVGFACVPFFKFIAPEIPVVGPFFAALEELPPAFILSALAGVTVSLLDTEGQKRVAGAAEELADAASE
ncbi:MAG: sodium/proline symporter [Deltaproteobacteria bacterium]|nr:MAG: sodium/proline symporter [Deltaproteobacteria bacterium]